MEVLARERSDDKRRNAPRADKSVATSCTPAEEAEYANTFEQVCSSHASG